MDRALFGRLLRSTANLESGKDFKWRLSVQVGDLVRFPGWKEVGIIVREVPGWANVKVVHWSVSGMSSHTAKDLEVLNAGR